MSRYTDPPDPDTPGTMGPSLRAILWALEPEYQPTDHPGIWTPTRTLWDHYRQSLRGWPTTRSAHAPEPLTLRQFGRALGCAYPGVCRVVRRVSGRPARGVIGLVGPGSIGSPGWAEYPARLLDFPPPNGWTPQPPNQTVKDD